MYSTNVNILHWGRYTKLSLSQHLLCYYVMLKVQQMFLENLRITNNM